MYRIDVYSGGFHPKGGTTSRKTEDESRSRDKEENVDQRKKGKDTRLASTQGAGSTLKKTPEPVKKIEGPAEYSEQKISPLSGKDKLRENRGTYLRQEYGINSRKKSYL